MDSSLTLTPELVAAYSKIIDSILELSDLTTVTTKNVRQILQSKLDYDISEHKSQINELIMARFNKITAEKPVQPKSPSEMTAKAPEKSTVNDGQASDQPSSLSNEKVDIGLSVEIHVEEEVTDDDWIVVNAMKQLDLESNVKIPKEKESLSPCSKAAIEAIQDFYDYLAVIGAIPESSIMTPPTSGWLGVDSVCLTVLGKTEEVVQLLKHLPYIKHPGDGNGMISYETTPIQYNDVANIQWCFDGNRNGDGLLAPVGAGIIPPHVAVLTDGSRYGSWLLLDTNEGKLHLDIFLATNLQ
jgi:hypothetical protein